MLSAVCCLAADCDLQWRNIHELVGSECPSYCIFSIFRKEQEIAISNIIFTFLILIVMVIGLGMMALDFQVLVGVAAGVGGSVVAWRGGWECAWDCACECGVVSGRVSVSLVVWHVVWQCGSVVVW